MTANEDFFDALVRHQVFLLRASQGMRKDIDAILDATEADLVAQIKRRMARSEAGFTPANVKRLSLLEQSIKKTRAKAFADIDALWVGELRTLAASEPSLVAGMLQTIAPVTLDLLLPSAETLRALVTNHPFEGRVLSKWSKGIREQDLNRIMSQVKIGVVQGEPSAAIARRVVGTVRQRGTNGVTEITRRNAAAITRTAVNSISNAARSQLFMANKGLFRFEVYTATLDSRTTRICSSLDGHRFPVGEGRFPPLHFNCRSIRVAILDNDLLGDRPMKAITQKQLLRRYADQAGIPRTATRAGLPRGHKGAFDQFARGEVRKMTGFTPAEVNYQQWLTRQSTEFVDDVLGPTRSQLFRKGDLKLDRFVNRAGDELNLRELAQKNRSAFTAAGLDPEDFL